MGSCSHLLLQLANSICCWCGALYVWIIVAGCASLRVGMLVEHKMLSRMLGCLAIEAYALLTCRASGKAQGCHQSEFKRPVGGGVYRMLEGCHVPSPLLHLWCYGFSVDWLEH